MVGFWTGVSSYSLFLTPVILRKNDRSSKNERRDKSSDGENDKQPLSEKEKQRRKEKKAKEFGRSQSMKEENYSFYCAPST